VNKLLNAAGSVRVATVLMLSGLVAVGCASIGGGSPAASAPKPKVQGSSGSGGTSPATSRTTPAGTPVSSPTPTHSPRSKRGRKPLAGKLIGIDPGHNGLNGTDPAFLDHQIFNGRQMENCNTTGTQTAAGYTEALFNWNVATYLVADLHRDGARVVLTRHNNHGVGPCVNTRSTVLNHTDVAIDIHADGGPTWGRGFTVLEPVADGPNDKVIASSLRFGSYVHSAFIADTPFRPANYYGHNGYIFRDDLAGLNLTTVPKVLIECGNMPNTQDAALLSSSSVQQHVARALEAAIIKFLDGHWPKGTAR
jgi:N-acetylmuramoyl-L-alanine amidase